MVELTIDRSRGAWWLLGICIAGAVGYFLVAFVGTVVFGLFLYYASRPLNRRLQGLLPSRGLAAVLSLLALTVPTLLLLGYTLAVALRDLQAVLAGIDNSAVRELLEPHLAESTSLQRPGTILTNASGDLVQEVLATTLGYLGFVGNGLLHVFIMFTIAFYLLRDDRRIGAWLHHRFGNEQGNLTAYLAAVDRDLHNIFFGNLLNILLTGAIGAVTFTVLNGIAPMGVEIPHPVLLGFLTGIASLVPILGMKVVIVPVAGFLVSKAYLADAAGYWFAVVFLVVSLVVVDGIPDIVLRPYISARELHTGLVLMAYLLGPLLFGWYGLFLGPILLVLVVQFTDQILPDLMAGRPIRTVTTEASIKGEMRVTSSPLFVDVEGEIGHAGSDDGESEQPDGDPSVATD